MSDSAAWKANWWQEEKAMSLARRAARPTKVGAAKPGDTFLIVTEGTVTEPIYFELLRSDLQLPAVRVKVMPGDASDPRHVIRSAEREAKEQVRRAKKGRLGIDEPSKFDQVWAVIDTDVAVRNGLWNDVQQLAIARKVTLAHSTPSFEFWLLLHFGFTTRSDLPDGSAAKAAVKATLGGTYGTTEEVTRTALSSFLAAWPIAVVRSERVREHHITAATPPPGNPSTEVDRLVRAMNDSAPAHLRRLEN
jgi:RloB-like protein